MAVKAKRLKYLMFEAYALECWDQTTACLTCWLQAHQQAWRLREGFPPPPPATRVGRSRQVTVGFNVLASDWSQRLYKRHPGLHPHLPPVYRAEAAVLEDSSRTPNPWGDCSAGATKGAAKPN